MATSDVPGANRANQDELAAGCWAEHDDGSLILVNAVSDDRVIFEIFDPAGKAGESVRDEYPVEQFKVDFSWPANGDKWVWHDKTPFPYERIMTDRSKSDTAARRLREEVSAPDGRDFSADRIPVELDQLRDHAADLPTAPCPRSRPISVTATTPWSSRSSPNSRTDRWLTCPQAATPPTRPGSRSRPWRSTSPAPPP